MDKLKQLIDQTLDSYIYKHRTTTVTLCDIINSTLISVHHSLATALMKVDYRDVRLGNYFTGEINTGQYIFNQIVWCEQQISDKYRNANEVYNILHQIQACIRSLKNVVKDEYIRQMMISVDNTFIELNLFFRNEIDYRYNGYNNGDNNGDNNRYSSRQRFEESELGYYNRYIDHHHHELPKVGKYPKI